MPFIQATNRRSWSISGYFNIIRTQCSSFPGTPDLLLKMPAYDPFCKKPSLGIEADDRFGGSTSFASQSHRNGHPRACRVHTEPSALSTRSVRGLVSCIHASPSRNCLSKYLTRHLKDNARNTSFLLETKAADSLDYLQKSKSSTLREQCSFHRHSLLPSTGFECRHEAEHNTQVSCRLTDEGNHRARRSTGRHRDKLKLQEHWNITENILYT